MGHLKTVYVQVLIGIVLGSVMGWLFPALGALLKPLADLFIALIRLVVAPVVFCTVAGGIARMGDLRALGRVGWKSLLYFEAVSTLALLIGVGAALLIHPGVGLNIAPSTLDPSVAAPYLSQARENSFSKQLTELAPLSFLQPLATGDILQTLVIATLTGVICAQLGPTGARVAGALDTASRVFFGMIHLVVRFAPVAAFAAMGFTIGRFGVGALIQLGAVVGAFYLTAATFVVVVLGGIAAAAGFSIFSLLGYIREELLIVLGTSSSESVLPQMLEKLERLGVAKPVAGLVIPAGYSFNLEGTNIYLTLATLFLAQATNTPLSLQEIAAIVVVAMLTSKGATGVASAGFIALAATLAIVPQVPIAAIALLVGVDRFMSECRALVNLIGNAVAAIAVARWDKQLDVETFRRELSQGPLYT